MPIQEIGVLFVYFREQKKKNGFFIFESDNGKFWVELSGRCYFLKAVVTCVLTESNHYVKLIET